MELAILGLNMLLVMAVWKYMLRKTILDSSRDKLFDLRDNLRSTFVKNGWDLGSPSYKHLRDLVNGHLRFTEEMSLSRIAYINEYLKQSPELLAYQHEKIAKIFDSSDPAQKKFIEQFRKNSVTIVMEYTIYSSGWLLIIALLVFPFLLAKKTCVFINRQVDTTTAACVKSFLHFGKSMSIVMAASADYVGRSLMQPDFVEGYSYRQGIAGRLA